MAALYSGTIIWIGPVVRAKGWRCKMGWAGADDEPPPLLPPQKTVRRSKFQTEQMSIA